MTLFHSKAVIANEPYFAQQKRRYAAIQRNMNRASDALASYKNKVLLRNTSTRWIATSCILRCARNAGFAMTALLRRDAGMGDQAVGYSQRHCE